MQYIHATDPKPAIEAMVTRIAGALGFGRRVLWLVCGGSNVSTAVSAMNLLRTRVEPKLLSALTIALTDERYGAPGHRDSNWQQLVDAGFNFHLTTQVPVLVGKSLDATVAEYSDALTAALEEIHGANGIVVALFGIGADGHIAGILPDRPDISECAYFVVGYEAGPYIRITLTPAALRHVDAAYAFACGDSKAAAMRRLVNEKIPLVEQPAQILKEIEESAVYADTVI